jgi:hypothetical protein
LDREIVPLADQAARLFPKQGLTLEEETQVQDFQRWSMPFKRPSSNWTRLQIDRGQMYSVKGRMEA